MKKFHPWLRFLVWKDSLSIRNATFLQRRPHRSFKRTRRRDYVRSLKLPGYWSFTAYVWLALWRSKKTFISLAALYAVVAAVLGAVTSQATYQEINNMVKDSVGAASQGAWDAIFQSAALLVTTLASPEGVSPEAQVLLVVVGLLVWLTTLWLLRDIMAGRKPKLRDGLYSAGSPLVATAVLAFVAALQMVPFALVMLAFSGLSAVGLLDEGLAMMLFGLFAVLIVTLILYWMTATILALVIIALPGMYPLHAMKIAGDVVVGRRLRILYRLLWLGLTIVLAWVLVLGLTVTLDSGLKNLWPAISGLPIVPFMAAVMSSVSLVWSSAYIYLLYRKVIADDASPA